VLAGKALSPAGCRLVASALPKRERIYTLAGLLRLQRLEAAGDDAPPGPELTAEIRRMASWADATTQDP